MSISSSSRLKKADRAHIENIFLKEGLSYTKKDIESVLRGNKKGQRYGGGVFLQKLEGLHRKVFLKVVIDGKRETWRPFSGQVKVTDMLSRKKNTSFSVTKVFSQHIFASVPYALFETRENGKGYGFMNDAAEDYASLSRKDADAIARTMYDFHALGKRLDQSDEKYIRNIFHRPSYYKKYVKEFLGTVVTHKDKEGRLFKKSVKSLLETYFGTEQALLLKDALLFLCDKADNFKQDKKVLIHADFQIANLYKRKDGAFEPLDLEWVSITDNPVIALMYDYGNLRSRSWSAPSFQTHLDSAAGEIGCNFYSKDVVDTGLFLGRLFYGLMMARYHLDYVHTVKRNKHSEQEYQRMYQATLKNLLKSLKEAKLLTTR